MHTGGRASVALSLRTMTVPPFEDAVPPHADTVQPFEDAVPPHADTVQPFEDAVPPHADAAPQVRGR
jgi:hypothetical protein